VVVSTALAEVEAEVEVVGGRGGRLMVGSGDDGGAGSAGAGTQRPLCAGARRRVSSHVVERPRTGWGSDP
jgi:hypothetical protein